MAIEARLHFSLAQFSQAAKQADRTVVARIVQVDLGLGQHEDDGVLPGFGKARAGKAEVDEVDDKPDEVVRQLTK